MKILVINGPNLNLLGIREPEIYGNRTYADLVELCTALGAECVQSNHEGAIIDMIHGAMGVYDGIVINPAAYTHTSIAIADALKAVGIPAVEVHLSDISRREEFRRVSYTAAACVKTISGMGIEGYAEAIRYLTLQGEIGNN
jgi:3-dehydroquinate dehydratase-2